MGISSESHLRPGLQAFSSGLIPGAPSTLLSFFVDRCVFAPRSLPFSWGMVHRGSFFFFFFWFLFVANCRQLSPQHEWCSYVRGRTLIDMTDLTMTAS